ncbi:IS110 family transposase [Verrucomicrobia bacterium S94]|nr:IS110 family transposase [Verrucomicrobia bacterium S94]
MKQTPKNRMFPVVPGIDWADEKHDICLWDAKEQALEYGVIKHRPEVLDDWFCRLRDRFPGEPIAVGLEQSKGALAFQLMQYGFITIYFVHPATVAKVRDAWTPSGAKDDPSDAELIMSLVRDSNHKLKAWRPDSPDTRRLMLLTEHRRKLVDLRGKLTNELRSCLKSYYPLACEVAGDKLNERLALDFLTRWPSFEKLKRSRLSTVRSFYTHGNSRYSGGIEKRLEAIEQAEPVTTDEVITESFSMQMPALVAQLKQLRKSIQDYDRLIVRTYAGHDDAAIISSFPATGKVFGPRLIAAIGTDRSGKAHWVHRRWKCSNFVRQSFHEWANETTKHSLWTRAFYIQAREKGMGHQAVRALAYKWIRILYRCWKEQIPYDELHYISLLKRRGSGLIKIIYEHPDAIRLNGPIESQFLR